MTTAPPNLLALRTLLIQHLPLSGNAVGIVGDPNHRGGYHCGRDRLDLNDYSVDESSRDRAGLSDYASALDIGWWEHAGHDLRHMSAWLVRQCEANTSDTADIREIIYSPDGRTVKRWDRLGRRTSGDSSHIGHTHISFFRDATKANRDLRPLFVRYLTSIGLIPEDDMDQAEHDALIEVRNRLRWMDGRVLAIASGAATVPNIKGAGYPNAGESVKISALLASLSTLPATLAQLAGRDLVDEPAIVAGVLAGLTPEAIAAAIPPTVARQVVDELVARLASTEPS